MLLKKLQFVLLGRGEVWERYLKIERENKVLRLEMRAIEAAKGVEKTSYMDVPVLGFDSIDGEPTDTELRKGYVERVDEFYADILKEKLRVLVAEVRELYGSAHMEGNLNIPRVEYDWFVRGIEAGLFKINEWCTTLQAERNSVLQEKENNKE